ncbi:MAG: hypothetical protein U0441_24365 [Polyangiaceae bacterium]
MSSPLAQDLAQKIIDVLLQRQHVLLSKGGKQALVRELADRMNERLATIIGRMPPPGIVDNEVTSTFGDESLDDAVEEMVEDVTASLMDSDQVEDVFSEDSVIRRDVFRIVKETLLSADRSEGEADEADVEVTLSTLGYVATKAAQGASPAVVETALSRAAKSSRAKLLKYAPATLTAVFRAALSGPDARLELEEAVADELSNLVDEGLVELPMIERRIAIGRSVASDERHSTRARIDVAATRTLLRSGCTATWEYVADDTIKVSLVPMSDQDGRSVDAYVEAFTKEVHAVFNRPRPDQMTTAGVRSAPPAPAGARPAAAAASGGGRAAPPSPTADNLDAWLRLAKAAGLTGSGAGESKKPSAGKGESKSARTSDRPEKRPSDAPLSSKKPAAGTKKAASESKKAARESTEVLAEPTRPKSVTPKKPAEKEPKAEKAPAKSARPAKEPKPSAKKPASKKPAKGSDDASEPRSVPKAKLSKKPAAKPAGKTARRPAKKAVTKKAVAKRPVKRAAAKKSVAKKAVAKKPVKRVAAKKAVAKKAVTKKPVKRGAAKKAVAKRPVKRGAVKKAVAKRSLPKRPVKRTAAKKPVRRTAAKKPVARKPVKRAIAKKPVAKKPVKRTAAKKPVAKRPASKRPVVRKANKRVVARRPAAKKPAAKSLKRSVGKKSVARKPAKRAAARRNPAAKRPTRPAIVRKGRPSPGSRATKRRGAPPAAKRRSSR